MALHGEIKVNHHEIGRWEAVRAGSRGFQGEYIYRCKVDFTDMAGNRRKRMFYLFHDFADGALVLGGKVMLESVKHLADPTEYTESTVWQSFCADNDLNPYSLLD